MGRACRLIESNKVYEISLRVKKGLPFPCWELIKTILKSTMARAARNEPARFCHFIWLGNHLHMLVVTKDARAFERFYGEVAKNLTEYVKALSGKRGENISLWEGRPMVAQVIGLDAILKRIVYFYTNPASADLVETIGDYPGLSSWEAFNKCSSMSDKHVIETPWVRLKTVRALESNKITRSQDEEINKYFKDSNKHMEKFILEPNAWAEVLGLTEQELTQANNDIRTMIAQREENLKIERKLSGKQVIGAQRLRLEAFMKPHIPKKKNRNIFCISSDTEARIAYIQKVKELQQYCHELYQKRLFHLWPPGMFRPPFPPIASAI